MAAAQLEAAAWAAETDAVVRVAQEVESSVALQLVSHGLPRLCTVAPVRGASGSSGCERLGPRRRTLGHTRLCHPTAEPFTAMPPSAAPLGCTFHGCTELRWRCGARLEPVRALGRGAPAAQSANRRPPPVPHRRTLIAAHFPWGGSSSRFLRGNFFVFVFHEFQRLSFCF